MMPNESPWSQVGDRVVASDISKIVVLCRSLTYQPGLEFFQVFLVVVVGSDEDKCKRVAVHPGIKARIEQVFFCGCCTQVHKTEISITPGQVHL